MPTILAVNDRIEVSYVCNLQGQYSYNIANIKITATAGASITDQQLAASLEGTMAPLYKAILPTNTQWHGLKVQIVNPLRRDAVFSIASRGAGVVAGDLLPTQAALVVSLRTGVASRATMGRWFFPPTSESNNDTAAVPSAAYQGSVGTLCNAMRLGGTVVSGADSATWQCGVWSRKLSVFTPITAVIVRNQWATIRKRSHVVGGDKVPF